MTLTKMQLDQINLAANHVPQMSRARFVHSVLAELGDEVSNQRLSDIIVSTLTAFVDDCEDDGRDRVSA